MIRFNLFRPLWLSVLLIIRSAPIELRNLVVLTLISSTGPNAVILFNKIIIDKISTTLEKGVITNPIEFILQQPLLLGSIGGLILLSLLNDSIHVITNLIFTSLKDRVQGYVQERVLQKVASFGDIILFETPELLNLVQLAEKGVERLQQLSLILITSMNGLFIFIPAVLLSGSIAWWIPIILFFFTSPSTYIELKYRKQSWEIEKTQASNFREMNLYKSILMGESYAKELRLFGLQTMILERWKVLFRKIFRAMQQVRREGILTVVSWSILGGLGIILPYIYVVTGVLRGSYTLGDLALYSGLLLQVRQSLYLLINSGAELYDAVLGTNPIFQLLKLKPNLQNLTSSKNAIEAQYSNRKDLQTLFKKESMSDTVEIQIKNLSFSYPGSDRKTLEDINLTLHSNEMVVFVGENGAGKTTITKLLCRLYEPTIGEILWNGQDIRELDLDELRSQITVVLQDYARFPTTLRENVGFGCLPLIQEDIAIENAIMRSGITGLVEHLSQGLETPLTKQLEGGVDLSGGQWQRIALARSLIRLSSSKLLIFDEPTAALDPKTEHEIYKLFRTIARGRITVVVSHRLSLAKLADRIFVLKDGKIIETGTHDELMEIGKHYHLMFTRQASSYY